MAGSGRDGRMQKIGGARKRHGRCPTPLCVGLKRKGAVGSAGRTRDEWQLPQGLVETPALAGASMGRRVSRGAIRVFMCLSLSILGVLFE